MTMKNKTKASKKADPKADDGGSMSLTGHLKELRNRILVILGVLIVGIVVSFSYAQDIVENLTDIGARFNYTFVYLKPQELLMVYFSISLLGGAILALPVFSYEAYCFAGPGLKKKERSFFVLAMIFGFAFFVAGVFFAYKITLPFMLRFLIGFSADIAIGASISIESYISFLLLVFVIFGVVFELPVISVLLTGLGIVKPIYLVKARKVMIVVIFVIAAVITPPDIVSQVMVAIPIIVLYELSILLSKVVFKLKKKDKDAAEEAENDEEDGEEEEEDA